MQRWTHLHKDTEVRIAMLEVMYNVIEIVLFLNLFCFRYACDDPCLWLHTTAGCPHYAGEASFQCLVAICTTTPTPRPSPTPTPPTPSPFISNFSLGILGGIICLTSVIFFFAWCRCRRQGQAQDEERIPLLGLVRRLCDREEEGVVQFQNLENEEAADEGGNDDEDLAAAAVAILNPPQIDTAEEANEISWYNAFINRMMQR